MLLIPASRLRQSLWGGSPMGPLELSRARPGCCRWFSQRLCAAQREQLAMCEWCYWSANASLTKQQDEETQKTRDGAPLWIIGSWIVNDSVVVSLAWWVNYALVSLVIHWTSEMSESTLRILHFVCKKVVNKPTVDLSCCVTACSSKSWISLFQVSKNISSFKVWTWPASYLK